MAESLGHDPNTLSGTHCLAGRPGNRTGCALLAEGGGIEPLTFAVTLVFRTSRQPSSGAFHWYPARTRTANLRVLSAAPLPDWATGANWYARSDSNRHSRGSRPRASCRLGYARMVRLLGFEPRP